MLQRVHHAVTTTGVTGNQSVLIGMKDLPPDGMLHALRHKCWGGDLLPSALSGVCQDRLIIRPNIGS